MILSGLISRWTTRAAWAAPSARGALLHQGPQGLPLNQLEDDKGWPSQTPMLWMVQICGWFRAEMRVVRLEDFPYAAPAGPVARGSGNREPAGGCLSLSSCRASWGPTLPKLSVVT